MPGRNSGHRSKLPDNTGVAPSTVTCPEGFFGTAPNCFTGRSGPNRRGTRAPPVEDNGGDADNNNGEEIQKI